MSCDVDSKIGQAYAREVRRREIGRKGCDDCGVRHYRRVRMIGTGGAIRRLCSECLMYRRIYGDETMEGQYGWF